MRGPHRRARGAAITLFAAWFGYASSGAPGAARAATPSDEERAARFATTLARSLTAIEDGARALDRDRFDPQFVVNTVGVEPEALFEWVRGETRWVPYRGLLRGAAGVLNDRVGSSLDRAVLLATLLTRAGEEVRLAHAELPAARARGLVEASILAARAEPGAATAAPPPAAVDARALALQYSLDPASIGGVLDDATRDSEQLTAATSASVDEQTTRLAAALGGARPDDASLAAAAEALADHWWVQLRVGGKWSDLDLLAPDGKPGSALAPAISTVALDAIPADLVHTVTIRVVAEQWKEGRVSEQVVSERAVAAHEALGERILLRHLPTVWPEDWPSITPDDVQIRLKAAVLTQREWIPVLVIGDTPYASRSIRDTGAVNDKPTPRNPFAALGIPAAGIAGKAADAFSAPPPGEKAAPPATPASAGARATNPDGELTAEWVDVEVHAPGIASRTVRRELFDLLGPARRAAGGSIPFEMSDAKALARSTAELAETELLVTPCALSAELVAHLGAEALLANKELLGELARDPFARSAPSYTETFTKLKPLPGPLLGFARLRFETSPVADRVFVDRPNVFAQHAELVADARGDFHPRVAIDVVVNDVGVDPGERDARGARLAQGIADTNAEAAALSGEVAVRGPAAAFGAAPGASWLTLAPGDEAKLAALGLEPDLAARLAAELRDGSVVVVPPPAGSGAGSPGWWRIDPRTGTTVGIGPNGWGQAMVEYMFVFLFEFTINQAICMLETAPMGNTKAAHAAARSCLIGSLWGAGRSLITMGLISRGRGGAGSAAGRGAAAAEEGAAGAGRGGPRGGGGAPFGEGGGSRTQPLPRGGPSPVSPKASTQPGAGGAGAPRSPAASTMPDAPRGGGGGRAGGVDPLGDTHPGGPPTGRPGAGGAASGDPAAGMDAARRAAQEAAAREQAAVDRFKREGTEEARRDAMKAWKDAGDARWDYTDAWRKAGRPGFPPELPGSPRTGGSGGAPAPTPGSSAADPYGRTSPGVDPLGRTAPIGGASDATAPGVDPLGKTSPGADPYGKTAPGVDPMGSTAPGAPPTQRSPSGGPVAGGSAGAPAPAPRPVGGPPPIGNAAPGGKLGDTRAAPYAPGSPAPQPTQGGLGALLTGFAGFGSSITDLGPP